jgi:hypothetical protein
VLPMLFFPAQGAVEIDVSEFVVIDENLNQPALPDPPYQPNAPTAAEHVPEPDLPLQVADLMRDNRVRDAVGALINASETPMAEFYVAVAALRSSRLRHGAVRVARRLVAR